ncbi:putative ribosome biogenesis protein [Metallosphaera sp. J1]|nr:putative ribosome biogenesis protein [Metallosphaera javensis (ex Hofmann et al. 2022)]
MVRLGFAKLVDRPVGVVLNPLSDRVLSVGDRETYLSRGITVLDSSWNRSDDSFFRKYVRNGRRLPLLFAGNPVNYSKPMKLSSLEAVVGSLYIMDEVEEALKLASIMKWGKTFLDLNRELLEAYRGKSEEEIVHLENSFIKEIMGEPRQ